MCKSMTKLFISITDDEEKALISVDSIQQVSFYKPEDRSIYIIEVKFKDTSDSKFFLYQNKEDAEKSCQRIVEELLND